MNPPTWEYVTRVSRPKTRDMSTPEALFAIFIWHDVECRHCDACLYDYSGHAQIVTLARRWSHWWVRVLPEESIRLRPTFACKVCSVRHTSTTRDPQTHVWMVPSSLVSERGPDQSWFLRCAQTCTWTRKP